MNEPFNKSRERAEAAFDKVQSKSLARNRAISESDAAVQARDEKTGRLRALRLAKEATDRAEGTLPESPKRSK